MDVGASLREARERHSLSPGQLSRATKISVAILRAIENNEIHKLPGGIYTRGLLRAYAREVGLDPEDTVKGYLAQFDHGTDLVGVAREGAPETRTARAVRGEMDLEEAARRSARLQLLIGAAALVISLVGYVTVARWRAPASRTAVSVSQPAGVTETARSPSGRPSPRAATPPRDEIATTGSRVPTRGTEGDVLQFDIRPQQTCWLSMVSDGTRVVYRLMQPGERQMIAVHDEVVLRVGDAAAFAFSINGIAGRPLGRAGQAVTVHITRANYREFLIR
jgi:cytoskeleton protein RodZ